MVQGYFTDPQTRKTEDRRDQSGEPGLMNIYDEGVDMGAWSVRRGFTEGVSSGNVTIEAQTKKLHRFACAILSSFISTDGLLGLNLRV